VSDSRLLPIPDGLDGLRLDVAISRLFGFSRTAAAGLVDAGRVTLDGASPLRSAKASVRSLAAVNDGSRSGSSRQNMNAREMP